MQLNDKLSIIPGLLKLLKTNTIILYDGVCLCVMGAIERKPIHVQLI